MLKQRILIITVIINLISLNQVYAEIPDLPQAQPYYDSNFGIPQYNSDPLFNFATGKDKVQTMDEVVVTSSPKVDNFHSLGPQETVRIEKPNLEVKAPTIDPNAKANVQALPTTKATEAKPNTPSKSVSQFMNSPAGILIISGISTIYSTVLYKAAAKQEDDSKDNIKKIDRLIATYKDSWTAFCPKGRDDLKEPNCYCYLDNGNQNPGRNKSQTCIDLWAKDSYKLKADADKYSGVPTFNDPVGCLNVNGQFDEKCSCKKFVDAKGGNACMKSSSITIPNNSFGSAFANTTGIQDLLRAAANTTNGSGGLNLLSEGLLANKAIATNKMLNSMISQIAPQKGFGKVAYINEQNVGQIAKAILGEKNINAAIASSKSPISMASAGNSDPKAAEILKEAASKAGLDLSSTGKGLSNKKENSKDGTNFNFAGENANNASQTQNFPETQKNYNYKNSDISKNSEESLFNIISNRYIQSGLKRLFEN